MSISYRARVGDPAVPVEGAGNGIRIARLVTGVLALCGGFLVWREFEPLLFFRPVDGVVAWSDVEKRHVYAKRRTTHYAAQIGYRYEVDGQRFLSWQFQRTIISGTRSAASRRARGYVVGAQVTAWYNPLNPADSVLSRAPNRLFLGILGFMGLVVWWMRQWDAPRRALSVASWSN